MYYIIYKFYYLLYFYKIMNTPDLTYHWSKNNLLFTDNVHKYKYIFIKDWHIYLVLTRQIWQNLSAIHNFRYISAKTLPSFQRI